MTETVEALKVTAYYEKKVNLGNYESETYGAYVPVPIHPNATDVDRVNAGDQAFTEAKAIVEGAIAGATPAAPAPVAAPPVAAPQQVAPAIAPAPMPAQEVAAQFGATVEPAPGDGQYVQYLIDNGREAELTVLHYDNRADIARGYREFNGQQKPVSPNSPHFKLKSDGSGIWPLKGSNPVRYA